MKELFEILQNFSKNKDNMDYNEDFCLIKTTMIHCNENLKNFSKIEFRGGEISNFPLKSQDPVNF